MFEQDTNNHYRHQQILWLYITELHKFPSYPEATSQF
jgi:hypothetical protein